MDDAGRFASDDFIEVDKIDTYDARESQENAVSATELSANAIAAYFAVWQWEQNDWKDLLQEEDASFNSDTDNNIASMMTRVTKRMQANQGLNNAREVDKVQPAVREMVKEVLSGLPHAKQCDWYLKGSTNERSTSNYRSLDDEYCRVYNPLRGTPDIEMKAVIGTVFQNQVYSSENLPDLIVKCKELELKKRSRMKISVDDCNDKTRLSPAKPPAEVKRGSVMQQLAKDFAISPNSSAVRQAALYGVMFMFRVFPMLPNEVLDEVFGPKRFIYVPLMSICEMVLLEIDVAPIVRSGMIRVNVTNVLTGDDYARYLCRWVSWSSRVSLALSKWTPLLKRRSPINSWVHVCAYKDIWPDMPDGFKPMPSFYNPIWYNESTKQYVRLVKTYWCNNLNGLEPDALLRSTGLLYMKEWKEFGCVLVVPDYGMPLSCDVIQNVGDFRHILLQVVDMLITLVNHGFVHCDIRLPNIIVDPVKKTDVRLIDFDFACKLIKDVRGRIVVTDSSPPDKLVTPKFDVWGFGIMLVRLCCSNATQNSLKEMYGQLAKRNNQCLAEFYGKIEFDPTLKFFDPSTVRGLIRSCVNVVDQRVDLVGLRGQIAALPQK
jgi:hypothetical protein